MIPQKHSRASCRIRYLLTFLLATSFCLPGSISVAQTAASSWKLENDQLTVTLSRKSGAIQAVLKKQGEVSYKNPATSPEALLLRIPMGLWEGHSALGSQGSGFEVRQQTADSITLTTSDFVTSEGKFPVDVEIRFRLEKNNLVTQLRLTNRSSHTIDQIAFPMLDLGPAADNSESIVTTAGPRKLRELFSQNKIRTHYDPFVRLDPESSGGWGVGDPAISAKAFEYPSGFMRMHSDWMLYRAGDLGIGWDVRDKSFQSQYAVVQRLLIRDHVSAAANRQNYRISWRWFPQVGQGKSWASPEVELMFGSTDWHELAKQHREWAETWMQRPKVAEKFQSSLGWLSRGITSFDQIPVITKTGVDVGAPYFIVYGWYIDGMNDLSYGYFPQYWLGGEVALRENLKKAQDLGGYPLAWYNGTTTVESTREHQQEGRNWVAVDSYDGIMVDGRWSLFDPNRPPTTDDATVDFNVDMGTGSADFNISNVHRMIEDYGFSGFEMDQAGKNFLSYSPHSKTGSPEFSYTNGARRVYEMSEKIVKAHDPNGIVVTEGISDFENQYSDSAWIYEGGALSVPFYSFFRYSIPWATLNARAVNDKGHADQAFMMNSPLDIFLDLNQYPEYAAHLKKLHALKEQIYKNLYQGDFSDGDGFTLGSPVAPGVMAKSYIETGHCTTVVVINSGATPQTATLNFTGPAGGRLTNYRLDGSVNTPTNADRVSLQLGPYDVNVLVLEQGEKQ